MDKTIVMEVERQFFFMYISFNAYDKAVLSFEDYLLIFLGKGNGNENLPTNLQLQ